MIKALYKISILFVLLLITVNKYVYASQESSFVLIGGGKVFVNTEVQAIVNIDSPENYNAFDLTINFTNLNYLKSTVNNSWLYFADPTVNRDKITFSGSLLGTYFTGNKNVMTITFKTTYAPGTAQVQINGSIFSYDNPGIPVPITGNTVSYSIVRNAFPGDANNDNVVNLMDLSILALNWQKQSFDGDFNDDGRVNLMDLSILALNWNKTP